MKDLILIIYNAKKIFLIWCFIGLLLGIMTAGGYYIIQKNRAITGDVSVDLILNYPGAESDPGSFSEIIIWENALKAISRSDISAADAMSQATLIKNEPAQDVPVNELKQNAYVLAISSDSKIFASDNEKIKFLNALCEYYKKYITDKYYNKKNTGMLYGQHLKTWLDSCRTIIWDPLCFDANFIMLSDRYLTLAAILEDLYNGDPAYRLPDGKSFGDYSTEFREICNKDIAGWANKLNYAVYIRNIDRFKEEAEYNINIMKINRERCLEIVDSYNKLLISFPQKDFEETADILTAARLWSDKAADLYYKINQTEYNLEMLRLNGPELLENSLEAEDALTAFIRELDDYQENLRELIYNYYAQKTNGDAEKSVIYTAAAVIMPEHQTKDTIKQVLLIFACFTFAGLVIGFFAALAEKYIPDKKNKKIKNKPVANDTQKIKPNTKTGYNITVPQVKS